MECSSESPSCTMQRKQKLAGLICCNKETKSLYSYEAIQFGLTYENRVFQEVKHYMKQKEGLEVTKCGLFLDPIYGFLAGSPDGDNTVLEIKCPFSIVNKDRLPKYLIECNGEYILDSNHRYFYQIQGELMVTGRKYALLAVYHQNFIKGNNIYFSVIKKDDKFIDNMRDKLKLFYLNYLRPTIIKRQTDELLDKQLLFE